MTQSDPAFFEVGGRSIAYRLRSGSSPTLVFFPGYASDMDGTKALALDAFAGERGFALLRLDYSGTGLSGGDFESGTLALWLEESLAAVDALTQGPLVLVGSSMGGWIALHVALARAARIAAIVGIAAAPDFTEWGISESSKTRLAAGETLRGHGDYGARVTTAAFWSSGQELRLLDNEMAIDCPVRLIHGEVDPDVPLDIAFRTMRALRSADVQIRVIKGGGHRLSEPHEIKAILRTVGEMLETVA
ncbi:MAG TPA: alpha/beta hydrolase [Sphingomicrobium sp.]|nr:alpha/beta hydrolase [Sphingomicrobium sp.]